MVAYNLIQNQPKGYEMKDKNKSVQKIVKFIDTYGDQEHKENIILADGLEEAFIGLTYREGEHGTQVAVYGVNCCINTLEQKNKWSREEAEDYFNYNIQCLYAGEYSPIFIEEMNR